MICFIDEHKDLLEIIDELKAEKVDLRLTLVQREAEVRFLKASEHKLEETIRLLRDEKKELMDDLLISSGVRMSKIQEQIMSREVQVNDNQPDFINQSSQWSQQMTSESLREVQNERNLRAIKLVDELERESGIKIPDGLRGVKVE